MSGAQRNQRKQNQRTASQRKSSSQTARAVASARGSNADRGKVIAGIVVVVVLAAAIIGGVLYSNSQTQAQTNDVIKTSEVSTTYPVKTNGAAIIAGKPDARVKLDLYEDFICPGCGAFNKMYFDQVEKAVEDGSVQVTYHFLPFLDDHSSPAGYSGRAANAALSVATNTPDKFVSYMHSLYADQAQEGTAGYTDDQLVSLGSRLGVGGSFANDVHGYKYKNTLADALQTALPIMSKASHGNPGTPTILHGDQPQEWRAFDQSGNLTKSPWLDNLLAGKNG